MNATTTIKKKNRQVVDFIKVELDKKKERHAKLVKSIDPKVIVSLKKMGKIEK